MWIVKIVTFIEYHPLLSLFVLLIFWGLFWMIRRELKRPSFRQQNDLNRLLDGLNKPGGLEGKTELRK